MQALAAEDVLAVWERTRTARPLQQAIAYAARAVPERSADDWAALPVGELCRALFHLRAAMFGQRLAGVASCPRCGEPLEFEVACADIAGPALPEAPARRARVVKGDRTLDVRLPTAADLLASRSADELLARCAEQPLDPDREWIAAASACVADADPLAETLVELGCPGCGHAWQALLDIVSYLTLELAHHARRLLEEVHGLATAYGWPEADILALAPARRRAYLELVGR